MLHRSFTPCSVCRNQNDRGGNRRSCLAHVRISGAIIISRYSTRLSGGGFLFAFPSVTFRVNFAVTLSFQCTAPSRHVLLSEIRLFFSRSISLRTFSLSAISHSHQWFAACSATAQDCAHPSYRQFRFIVSNSAAYSAAPSHARSSYRQCLPICSDSLVHISRSANHPHPS